jgi:diacylglycerol kinase family enzyme
MAPPEHDSPDTDMDLAAPETGHADRVLVLNPVSGDGDHGPRVRELAAEYGYVVRETERAGDAIDLARAAAESADEVVACGGDGTLNHVVRGLWEADALDDVRFGVVPGGTGNDFASNVDVTGIEGAFEVLAEGEERRVDLGTVAVDDGAPLPFLNSCICGLTADASAATTPDQKERYGTLAYAGHTLRELAAYDALAITIDPVDGGEGWVGPAALVTFGNARGFPGEDAPGASIEDGRLDVTVVADRPAADLVGGGALFELFDRDPESLSRLRTGHAEVVVENDESTAFSLDGEMVSASSLTVDVRERALTLPVGPAYDSGSGG